MSNQEELLEEQVLDWQFQELLKTLITFTMPAAGQIDAVGYGCVGDELANDFDSYYCHIKERLLTYKYINRQQSSELDLFDAMLNKYAGQEYYDFWCDPASLVTDKRWNEIRLKAKQVLVALGKQNLELRVNKYFLPSAIGDTCTVQVIKNELVEIKTK